MGTEEAILYSYDLATLPSILPAFANKKDLILCDEVRVGWGVGRSGDAWGCCCVLWLSFQRHASLLVCPPQ